MSECSRQSKSCSCGSLLTGLLFGAAVGAIVALLYAPRSGRETRQRLNARMRGTLDQCVGQVRTRLADARADLARAVAIGQAGAARVETALRRREGME